MKQWPQDRVRVSQIVVIVLAGLQMKCVAVKLSAIILFQEMIGDGLVELGANPYATLALHGLLQCDNQAARCGLSQWKSIGVHD